MTTEIGPDGIEIEFREYSDHKCWIKSKSDYIYISPCGWSRNHSLQWNYNNVKYPFTTDCWYLEGRRVGPYEVLGDTPEAFAWVMKYGR